MIGLTRSIIRSKSTFRHSALNECINIIKKRDYENYLCTLLIENVDLKRFGIIVRAFNCELANVRDVSRNRDMAKIRFEYWSETVAKLFQPDYYPPANEPISSELKMCIEKAQLRHVPLHWLRKLIDSRKNNISDFPFSTIQELEIYQEESTSPIYHLLIEYAVKLQCFEELLSQKRSRLDIDHLANHLGKCQGMMNLLRGLYRNALLEQSHIPNDLLAKHDCTHEDLIRLCYEVQKAIAQNRKIEEDALEKHKFKNFLELVFELATLAKQNLDDAIRIYHRQKITQKQTNYIFMPLYIQYMYLNDLERNEFNIFDPKLFVKRRRTLPIRLYFESFELMRLK